MKVVLFALSALALLSAQQTPVVLVNGYQARCPSIPAASSDTFGMLETLLAPQGHRVLFFDNCAVTGAEGRPSIEELGQAFGRFLESTGATQLDVVAHSMGGLIVRAYLAGMLPEGGFAPPAVHRIRKIVFLSTPHFGALAIAGFIIGSDNGIQARELVQGSRFLWDLGTWNRGSDDLRGVDALAVVADGGASSPVAGAHDGAVPVTSSAFTFGPNSVRVVPYCHERDLPSYLCRGPGVAYVTDPNHLTYRILQSFLSDGDQWRTLGRGPNQNQVLSAYTGALFRLYDARNRPLEFTPLQFANGHISGTMLYNPEGGFFADLLPSGDYSVKTIGGTFSSTLSPGGYSAIALKPGPVIRRVTALESLPLATGAIIALEGSSLQDAAIDIGGAHADVRSSSPERVEVIIPDGLSGLVRVHLENGWGVAETNILLNYR